MTAQEVAAEIEKCRKEQRVKTRNNDPVHPIGSRGFKTRHFTSRVKGFLDNLSSREGNKEECPSCQGTEAYHSVECPKFSIDDARAIAQKCIEEIEDYRQSNRDDIKSVWDKVSRARATAMEWKLKFLEVKHENNQLRKKIQP